MLKTPLRRLASALYRSKARRYLSRHLSDPRLSWLLPGLRRAERYVKYAGRGVAPPSDAELSRLNQVASIEGLFPAAHLVAKATRDGREYPRITIVTPNYNQGRFLEDCIKSVISQDYPNVELIITDGGSTDNSLEIIGRYADRLAWWVSEKDGGQADAINKGLARATGEIFNWLNADDRLAPGALLACAEAYQAQPNASGWVGGCVRTDEHGVIADIIYPNGVEREHIGENWNGRQFYQPSCFLATERLKAIGGLNPDLYIALDLDLWLRLLANGPLAIGRGIWSIALNHDEAKTQRAVDRMLSETADLQDAHGFPAGARARRGVGPDRPLRYVLPSPLGAELGGFQPSIEGRRDICFYGDFALQEDIAAVRFFLAEVFPIILRKNWVDFHIVGPHATRCGEALGAGDLRCHDEADVQPRLLEKFRVFVSPMIQRGGKEGRLSAATAAALPIVSTRAGCWSWDLKDGVDCFIADDPLEFAEKLHQVLNDDICWYRFSVRSMLLCQARNGPQGDAA